LQQQSSLHLDSDALSASADLDLDEARTTLGDRLEQTNLDERQSALRALLRQPLLVSGSKNGREFSLVRKHAAWLRDWLARHPGWSLSLDREVARLHKRVGDVSDRTRPAKDRPDGPPFSRRRYVLICLALAAMEDADHQMTLGWLADQVVANVARNPELQATGITFDLSSRDQRRDLVAAIRLLIELGVLHRVDGDEMQYINESGDALYTINRSAFASILHVQRGPSTVDVTSIEDRLEAIADVQDMDTPESRNRSFRTHLFRRLLDDPVVYYRDLGEDELAYLHSQRGLLLRQVEEATGLLAEVRSEGIAMVDNEGDLTDIRMLEQGTDGHLALLLAQYFATAIQGEQDGPIGFATIYDHTAKLIDKYRRYWRRDVSEPGAERTLTDATIGRLESLQLVSRTPDGIIPLPAIGRYALEEPPEVQSGFMLGEV
jgi:uncharacterized protein (TIGR02678 family)